MDNHIQKGKFIVLEGIDGAGKSSHLDAVVHFFEARNQPVVKTREPGGTILAEKLRPIILGNPMPPQAEVLLMFAARQDHLEQAIMPALNAGNHVVSDRFTDSTYAYQGAGHGVPVDRIRQLEQWVQDQCQPDLVFIFDVPADVAMARVQGVNTAPDCFERENKDFFERVRQAYLSRATDDPDRYVVMDGTQSLESVRERVLAVLKERFE